jgi:hypothetical protein
MTTAKMSPLRRRMVEDMQIRGLEATTQASYLRAIEAFAGFLGGTVRGNWLELAVNGQ